MDLIVTRREKFLIYYCKKESFAVKPNFRIKEQYVMQYLLGLCIIGTLTFSLFGQVYAQPVESPGDIQERINKLEGALQELKSLLKGQIQKESEKEADIKKLKEQTEEQQKKMGEVTKRDLEKEAEIKKLKEVTEEQKKRIEEAAKMAEAPADFYWAERSQKFYEKGLSPQFGDARTKPFLRKMGRSTYLGGYMDFEYRRTEEANNKDEGFDQKRLIPFIYSDVSDRVKLATEIEFEHGGPNGNRKGDGEIKLEFATVDFLIRDEINLRAGIILSPLGKFNLVHDSPLQDLTDRPMVDRSIIPTTLSESGAGFFGTFYPTELSKLDYEIYAVNGFEGLTAKGEARFNTIDGLREGKGSQKNDVFNGDPAVVGRLAFSPFLGLEFGGSFHTGAYDGNNDNNLTIAAFDTAYQMGPFELVGEFANAFIERDSFAKSPHDVNKDGDFKDSGEQPVPDDFWGYYIEPRYHFMPGFLKAMAPKIFTEDSTFTAVTRWEQLDLDGNKVDRITFGLNYRYTEDTVFKLDYQINTATIDDPDRPKESKSNTFLVSIATYF